MSRRTAGRLAWSMFLVDLLLHVSGWVLTLLADDVTPAFDLASSAALVVLPLVGALVASRRPGNAIGWLFCGAGLLLAVAGWTYGYAALALGPSEAALPGGVAAAWLASWVFLPAVFGVPPLLFLLFPDGRPLTPQWRWAVWFTLLGLSCQAVAAAVGPGPLEDSPVPGVANPAGIPQAAVVDAIEIVGWTVSLASILVGTCSLVLRFRRSSGEQRVQLRWFALSAVFFLVTCLVSAALFQTTYVGLGQVLILVAYNTIPVAAGVAILQYRLYDIDVVINRALVYGSLSAALAAVYLGSVLLLQLVLTPLAAESDLAVAASTLAVAAAFGPIRSRVQEVVDRRFYRRRYDASLTVEEFIGRLRHELDLEAVAGDFRSVVRETVQPSHLSLWLRRS